MSSISAIGLLLSSLFMQAFSMPVPASETLEIATRTAPNAATWEPETLDVPETTDLTSREAEAVAAPDATIELTIRAPVGSREITGTSGIGLTGSRVYNDDSSGGCVVM